MARISHPYRSLLLSEFVRDTSPTCFRHYRALSSTATLRANHYETLSLPKSATRSQIKSRFYKLSKDLHPDLNPSTEAKAKYLKVSEAYNTLGDERKRRDYDQTLQQGPASYSQSSPAASHSSWTYNDLNRRRGATHAWDTHPRNRRGAGPGFSRGDPRATGHFYSRYDDFTVHGTAKRKTAAGSGPREETPEQKVSNESVTWRVVQVLGVLWLVVTIGGGFRSAHA